MIEKLDGKVFHGRTLNAKLAKEGVVKTVETVDHFWQDQIVGANVAGEGRADVDVSVIGGRNEDTIARRRREEEREGDRHVKPKPVQRTLLPLAPVVVDGSCCGRGRR